MIGKAYFFIRWNNPIPGLNIDVGHIGWGFQLANNQYCCGSTENKQAKNPIPPGEDNDAWVQIVPSEKAMLQLMKQNYHSYKWTSVNFCNPDKALHKAKQTPGMGYNVYKNNCLDHACMIMENYGLPWQAPLTGQPFNGMPWKETHPAPNQWFRAFRPQEIKL